MVPVTLSARFSKTIDAMVLHCYDVLDGKYGRMCRMWRGRDGDEHVGVGQQEQMDLKNDDDEKYCDNNNHELCDRHL